jgi:hypothetical protein
LRVFLIIISFFLFNGSVKGQMSYQDVIDFSQHLSKLKRYQEANYELGTIDLNSVSAIQKDSVNHLLGYNFYISKQLDSSVTYFRKVSSGDLFLKSRYYSVISNVYNNKPGSALDDLRLLKSASTGEYKQLWLTESAGLALLERNYQRFDSLSQSFDYNYYPVAKEQKELISYAQQMQKIRHRSPFIAGALSAIVPGSGKLYAGYRGKAISSFLSATTLAIVATESYIKDGPKSPSFIIFSGLFSVFYVGNIWGSVLSVRIKQDESFREFDRNIMLDLHIPLRRAFN